MTFVSGKEFNQIFANTEFYKLLNISFVQDGFQYQNGVNTNIDSSKHFDFTDKENIFSCLYESHYYICSITIPDDSIVNVWDEMDTRFGVSVKYFKTNSFVLDLNNKIKISELKEWLDINFCKKNQI